MTLKFLTALPDPPFLPLLGEKKSFEIPIEDEADTAVGDGEGEGDMTREYRSRSRVKLVGKKMSKKPGWTR